MALKLKIKPEIEEEMQHLFSKAHVRSKTEYIHRAILEYNRKLKRESEVSTLESYFEAYKKEGKETLRDFARLKRHPH